jgi:hypothetical protein
MPKGAAVEKEISQLKISVEYEDCVCVSHYVAHLKAHELYSAARCKESGHEKT